MMRIEVRTGDKIEVLPIVRGETEEGTRLLVGKVAKTGKYVMWHENLSDKKHRWWSYMKTGERDNLVSELCRICGRVEDAESLPKPIQTYLGMGVVECRAKCPKCGQKCALTNIHSQHIHSAPQLRVHNWSQ